MLRSSSNVFVGSHVIQVSTKHDGDSFHVRSSFRILAPSFGDHNAGERGPFFVNLWSLIFNDNPVHKLVGGTWTEGRLECHQFPERKYNGEVGGYWQPGEHVFF